jgi:hypothetical protein
VSTPTSATTVPDDPLDDSDALARGVHNKPPAPMLAQSDPLIDL